jgi:hypothetical protein
MNTNTDTLKFLFSDMPQLGHSASDPDGSPQKINTSEVLQWIARNEPILSYLFYTARQCGAVQFIADQDKWAGCNVPSQTPAQPKKALGKVGRPRAYTVKKILDLLPHEPTSVSDWAAISMAEIGISRRKFTDLMRAAISDGLVTQTLTGRHRFCERTMATAEKTKSTPEAAGYEG